MSRRTGYRNPKDHGTHIIVGEGRSEKIYFDRIRSDYSNLLIHTADSKGGDIDRIKKGVNCEMSSFKKGDSVYVVMDMDTKTAKEIAEFDEWCSKKGVELHLFNPSFEVFLLMHYDDVSGSLSQEDLEQSITNHIGRKYDKGRGISLDEAMICDAVLRASKALPEKHSTVKDVALKPGTTTVHKLVKELADKLRFD